MKENENQLSHHLYFSLMNSDMLMKLITVVHYTGSHDNNDIQKVTRS